MFLQQLGRGLRKHKGKEYLNVLDFIGNYKKAGRTTLLLSGENCLEKATKQGEDSIEYPDDCIVDFDVKLIDLFKELEKKEGTIREWIREEYYRVKELLDGKVPTRMELFTYMQDEIYQLCMKYAKENPFQKYLIFLHELGELTSEQEQLYHGIAREFLTVLETTQMQKVYKMPVLYAFYNDGNIRMELTEEDLLSHWLKFFSNGTNWKDLQSDISYEEFQKISKAKHLSNIKQNPVKFLKASGKGFFIEKEGYVIALREELRTIVHKEAFQEQLKDIIEYRVMEYYRRKYLEK